MHATSPPMPPTMVVAHSLPELPSFQIAAQSYPRIVVPPVPLIVVEPPPVQLRLAVHDTPGSASIVTYAEVVLREWVVAQPATAATTSGAIQRNLTDQPLGCVSTDAEFNVPSWSSRDSKGGWIELGFGVKRMPRMGAVVKLQVTMQAGDPAAERQARGYRKSFISFSSAPDPGQSDSKGTSTKGVSLVWFISCMSGADSSR